MWVRWNTVALGALGIVLFAACDEGAAAHCDSAGRCDAEETISGGTLARCEVFETPTEVARLPDALPETSGMVASRVHDRIVWMHNDSGDGANVYGVDVTTGAVMAKLTLEGVRARDWEDLAIGACEDAAKSCIYVGDIGDNYAARADIQVLRFEEPAQLASELTIDHVEVMRVRYADVAAVDAESLFVHGSDVYILSKEPGASTLYHAPFRAMVPVQTEERQTMEPLLRLDFVGLGYRAFLATAADIHPSGSRILVRAYGRLLEFIGEDGDTPAQILSRTPRRLKTGFELQSEAVAYYDGGFVHAAEGSNAPLYFGRCATNADAGSTRSGE